MVSGDGQGPWLVAMAIWLTRPLWMPVPTFPRWNASDLHPVEHDMYGMWD